MVTINSFIIKTLNLYPNISKNDIELALMHYFNIDNYIDLRRTNFDVSPKLNELDKVIERLNKSEPIQYILGEAYFNDRKFNVTPAVLIPRPETEELVYKIINDKLTGNIVEIGTGSGCIALTLAKYTNLLVFATDVSLAALEVAKSNDADNKVFFLHGDMFAPLIALDIVVDNIVANLPYINIDEVLDKVVYDHEPHLALFDKENDIFERFFEELKAVKLNPNGVRIYLEFGTNQADRVSTLAKRYFTKGVKIEVIKDMSMRQRFLKIEGIYENKNI